MKKSTLAAISCLICGPTFGDEISGITISPMVGMSFYDIEGSDESAHGSIGIGYQFESPWALEFVYADTETEVDRLNLDIDFSRWHLDALYHTDTIGDIRPYFAFGVGEGEYDYSPGRDIDERLYNLGAGVKYAFADNTSFRGDLKAFYGTDENDVNMAISLGIYHVFGTASAAPVSSAPLDSDNDGVIDDNDACPDTPTGASVDFRGCPLDADKDGVADYRDQCPDTTNRSAIIDDNGCYEVLKEEVRIALDVEFDNDSANSRDSHRPEVKRVHDFMQKYPGTQVTIEGHTDSRGSEAYNQNLSERRAKTIADMLINDFGVSASRVKFVGYGEARPIADNNTADGRQRNRRVVGSVEATVETIIKK